VFSQGEICQDLARGSESLSRGVDLLFAQEFCFFKHENASPSGAKQGKNRRALDDRTGLAAPADARQTQAPAGHLPSKGSVDHHALGRRHPISIKVNHLRARPRAHPPQRRRPVAGGHDAGARRVFRHGRQRRLPHQGRDFGAAEAVRVGAGDERGEVHAGAERHAPRVDGQDGPAGGRVGQPNVHEAVHTAGAKHRRVDQVGPVGGADDHHVACAAVAVAVTVVTARATAVCLRVPTVAAGHIASVRLHGARRQRLGPVVKRHLVQQLGRPIHTAGTAAASDTG